MKKKGPDFLIVGVPKAGTTSLYNYLGLHNKIVLSDIKEPHYFVSSCLDGLIPNCVTGYEDYFSLFENAGEGFLSGEASVFYFYFSEVSIGNIIRSIGRDVKIIIMLRNPIDRAYSAYRYVDALNPEEKLDFSSAIDLEVSSGPRFGVSPMLNYVSCGMYSANLKLWIENFPNVKVVFFDDFVRDPYFVTSSVIDFLGLDSSFVEKITKVHNKSLGEWKNPYLGKVIKKMSTKKFRRLGNGRLFPLYSRIKDILFTLSMRPSSEMSPEMRMKLYAIFRDDISEVEKFLSVDLESWRLGHI